MAAEPCEVFEFERCFKFLLHDKMFLVLISQGSDMPCGFLILACLCFIFPRESSTSGMCNLMTSPGILISPIEKHP